MFNRGRFMQSSSPCPSSEATTMAAPVRRHAASHMSGCGTEESASNLGQKKSSRRLRRKTNAAEAAAAGPRLGVSCMCFFFFSSIPGHHFKTVFFNVVIAGHGWGGAQHWAQLGQRTSLTFGAGEFSFFWLSRYCIFFLLTLLHLLTFFLVTLLHLSAFHLLFNSPYCRKFTI